MSDPAPATTFERRFEVIVHYLPYITLAISAPVSLLMPGQTADRRLVTLGLAGLALVWVFGTYTLPGAGWRARRPAMAVYYAGYLVTAVLLMTHDRIFLIYGISGFFQAHLFAPSLWTFGAVAASSVALYASAWDWSHPTPTMIILFVAVVVVQTLAAGSGLLLGNKWEIREQKYRKALADLEAAMEENAGLHAQLMVQAREAGKLDERQRLAGEIHDTIAQGVTGIITQLQAAHRVDDPEPHLDRALSLARESLNEARRSVRALRPRELEEAHLPDALTGMARRWADTTEIRLDIDITGDPTPLSPAIEVALFRTAQEALTNVAKHAQATRAGLTLSYLDDTVLLDVRDNGAGIGRDNPDGFGLDTMRRRISDVGGTLQIETTHGEGTAVSAGVPAITPNGRAVTPGPA